MLNGVVGPIQPLAVGVTTICQILLVFELFNPVKDEISPLPDNPRPIVLLSFTQLKVVPETLLVKFTSTV